MDAGDTVDGAVDAADDILARGGADCGRMTDDDAGVRGRLVRNVEPARLGLLVGMLTMMGGAVTGTAAAGRRDLKVD
jgi:hypothetical protein